MKYFSLLFSFTCAAAIYTCQPRQADSGMVYCNPLSDSIIIGDPFMLLHQGTYYLYGTTSSSHGFKCYSSTDMTEWKEEGFALKKTENSYGERNFWAPEVSYYNGEFYMAYSCKGKDSTVNRMLLCLAKSSSPTGPFEDLYAPWFDMGFGCIDAHLFFDDNKTWLYFDKVGYTGQWPDGYLFGKIYTRELDHNLKPVGDTVFCSQAEQDWEHPLSDHSRCNEGSFVFKHNDNYYMTYSANHFEDPFYGIGYSTAPSPDGPWTKSVDNPLISMDTTMGIYGPGHNCFVRSPDGSELFIVYHTHIGRDNKKRLMNIDRVMIDDNGKLKVKGPTRTPQKVPSGI